MFISLINSSITGFLYQLLLTYPMFLYHDTLTAFHLVVILLLMIYLLPFTV